MCIRDRVITAENEISTDEVEIRQMAKIGSQKGFIEADEAAMIFKVFQLNDLKAKDLMTPRVSAPCLDGSSNLDEISKLIMSDSSPWWVILGDKVDKIQGIANRENLLAEIIKGKNKKLLSVPILRLLNILMRPFLILIEQIFPVITAENEISTDEEEIRQMAKIGSQKGLIEPDEAAMIFLSLIHI